MIGGASLVVQWLRICLPMQGTRVRALVWEIPHAAEQLGPCVTTAEPARLEPVLHDKRGRDSERPAHRDEEWPPFATTRESPRTETKTQHSHKSINQSINQKKRKKMIGGTRKRSVPPALLPDSALAHLMSSPTWHWERPPHQPVDSGNCLQCSLQ